MTHAGATPLPRSPVHDLQRILAAGLSGDRAATRRVWGPPGRAGIAAARLPRMPVGPLERMLSLGILGGVAATLVIAQLVMVLLSEWPSSAMLWRLYFQLARPLDVFYQMTSYLVGEMSLLGFVVVVLAVAGAAVAAIHSGVRLLRAIAYHGLLAMAGALFFFGSGHADATMPIFIGESTGFTAVALLLGLLALGQCLRMHAEYFLAAGAARRLAAAAVPVAAGEPADVATTDVPVDMPAGPRLVVDTGLPPAPRRARIAARATRTADVA